MKEPLRAAAAPSISSRSVLFVALGSLASGGWILAAIVVISVITISGSRLIAFQPSPAMNWGLGLFNLWNSALVVFYLRGRMEIGKDYSIWRAVEKATFSFPRLCLFCILLGLIILLFASPLVLLTLVLGKGVQSSSGIAALFLGLLVIYITPWCYLLLRIWPAYGICLLEHFGPVASFIESWKRTTPFVKTSFVVLLVGIIPSMGFVLIEVLLKSREVFEAGIVLIILGKQMARVWFLAFLVSYWNAISRPVSQI